MSEPPASARSPSPSPIPSVIGAPVQFRIEEGVCWAMLAFDVGAGIDLEAAHRALSPAAHPGPVREALRHQQRGATYLQFAPPPLRVDESSDPVTLSAGGPAGTVRTDERVEVTLFDFGAVSVAYRIPISGDLSSLAPLAEALHENAELLADSRRRVERLVGRLGAAVRRASISAFVEDYVVFHVRRWSGAGSAVTLSLDAQARSLAAILRAERGPLSDGEVRDAVASRISYTPNDAAVIDWNGAIVFDAHAEDVLAVLEFANVELLEMRFLDERLDGVLDRAYSSLHTPEGLRRLLPGHGSEERRRLAALQMDSALLFEGINNAIKLVGDQYLARLYRLAALRLHLQDWDASIIRKLQTLDGIYQKMTDAAATRRMELLEWIIIILIAVSIVIPFLPGLGGGGGGK